MSLPSQSDYQQILQNPKINLSDPRLKRCSVERDQLGMPRVRSGGFALTYKLVNGSQRWALRCFHKEVLEREARYDAIGRYLTNHTSDILVPVEYIKNGVLFKGNWFPVTIMGWVEGDTLEKYLYGNHTNPQIMNELAGFFLHVVQELDRLKIAHGDLSQANIIVVSTKMVLVDYDGMFVPSLANSASTEIGNQHFQHPRRTASLFNEKLDYFSEIVIYLTLKGLSLRPSLYSEFRSGGEGLLFSRVDFIDPHGSRLLAELEKLPGLQASIRQFRSICLGNVSDIPRLSDFIANVPIVIEPSQTPIELLETANQILTLDAANRGTLLENRGEYATVIGKITKVHQSISIKKQPYAMMNVGLWPNQSFTAVLWSESLNLMTAAGQKPHEYENQWVAVTGLITSYDEGPQIVLESPSNIKIISEKEAKNRLSEGLMKGFAGPEQTLKTKPSGRIRGPQVTSSENPFSTINLRSASGSNAKQSPNHQTGNQGQKVGNSAPQSSMISTKQSANLSRKNHALHSKPSQPLSVASNAGKPVPKGVSQKHLKKGFWQRLFEEIDRVISGK